MINIESPTNIIIAGDSGLNQSYVKRDSENNWGIIEEYLLSLKEN